MEEVKMIFVEEVKMIFVKDIKLNSLLWWGKYSKRNGYPVIVIEKKGRCFRVKCLNNCNESGPIYIGLDKKSRESKTQICSLEYAKKYCREQIKNLEYIVTEKRDELKKAKKTLNEYQENVEAFLKKCS